jgi:hypothetical protein
VISSGSTRLIIQAYGGYAMREHRNKVRRTGEAKEDWKATRYHVASSRRGNKGEEVGEMYEGVVVGAA